MSREECASLTGLSSCQWRRIEESCSDVPISMIRYAMRCLAVPVNAPQPPPGMPPDLARSFGGALAAPDRLPMDLWWYQAPEKIAVFNVPWGRQERPRAASSGKRLWVHDDADTKRQKKRVTRAIKAMGIELGKGPIAAYLSIFPKTRQGDADNVGKLQLDCGRPGGLWSDDNMLVLQDVGLRFAGVSKAAPFVRFCVVKWKADHRHYAAGWPSDEERVAAMRWAEGVK